MSKAGANLDMNGLRVLNLPATPSAGGDAASKTYVDSQVSSVSAGGVPTGCIMGWGPYAIPSGWLLCNGQSTTGYPALAALCGSTVPNLSGKFVLGAGTGAPQAAGNSGGSTTITTANMPNHWHFLGTGADGTASAANDASSQHTHGYTRRDNSTAAAAASAMSASGTGTATTGNTNSADSASTHNHNLAGHTQSQGGGANGTGNNSGVGDGNYWQPYYVINWIIKT